MSLITQGEGGKIVSKRGISPYKLDRDMHVSLCLKTYVPSHDQLYYCIVKNMAGEKFGAFGKSSVICQTKIIQVSK